MSIQTESSYVFYGGSVSLIVYKVRRVNDSSRIDRVKLTSALIVNAFAILHCFTTHVQVPISKGYPEKTSNTSIFFSILFVVVCALNKKSNKNSAHLWNYFCASVYIGYSVSS